MKPPLLGQTAIVTGGARGIGLAIAQRLTELGCGAVIWDVDVSSLGGSGSFQPALAQCVDVTDRASIERAFTDSVKSFIGQDLGEEPVLPRIARNICIDACDSHKLAIV